MSTLIILQQDAEIAVDANMDTAKTNTERMDQIIALLNKPTKKMKKKAEDKKVRYGKNDFVYHLLLLMWSKTQTDTYLDFGCGNGSITD